MVKSEGSAGAFAETGISRDAAAVALEEYPCVDIRRAVETARPPPPDARWVRGVAVPPGVAQDFLSALRAEYVESSLGATQSFLDSEVVSRGVVMALAIEQRTVRHTSDPAVAIRALAVRWGFEAPLPPQPAAAPATPGSAPELRVVFKTLVRARRVAERKTVVFSKSPLGMVFNRVMPMVVSEVTGHAQELGVQLGWEVEAINDHAVEASWNFERTYGIFTSEAKRCLG